MGRSKRLLRARWAISAAAVFAVAAMVLVVFARGRAPRTTAILTVSRPRTVATLPGTGDWSTYTRLSWLANDTLAVNYRFDANQIGGAATAGQPWCRVSGVARVHIDSGEVEAIRPSEPIGDNPRVVYRWSDRGASGAPVLGRLPPIAVGRGGVLSVSYALASPVSGRIAYRVSIVQPEPTPGTTSAQTGLWIADQDGSRAVRVVPSPGRPAMWSPDGRILLFLRDATAGSLELWSCRDDGTNARRVAASALWFAISSDSRRVAFCRKVNDQWRLYLADVHGGPERLVAKDAWSPMWLGGSLLFVSRTMRTWSILPWDRVQQAPLTGMGSRVDILDPATRHRTTIARAGTNEAFWGMGAPDGGADVFLLLGPAHGEELVGWICARDGDGLKRVEMEDFPAWHAWSPDGRKLAYMETERGEIRIVDVSLRQVKRQ